MCKNTFQWILRFEEAGHWKRVFASILIVDVGCPSPQSARHRRDENEQGKIKHLRCNRARSTGSHTARFPKLKVSPSSSPCAPGSLRVSAEFHRDFRHRTPRTVPGGDPSWIAPFAFGGCGRLAGHTCVDSGSTSPTICPGRRTSSHPNHDSHGLQTAIHTSPGSLRHPSAMRR